MVYQAELTPDTVFFNNNLVIFDGANSFMGGLDDAMSASNNLIVESDPGVVNIAGITAADFDLVAGSAAIDQGINVPTHTLDFFNRTVPDPSGLTDIGAFEYGSAQGADLPPQSPIAGDLDDYLPGSGGSIGKEGVATSLPPRSTVKRAHPPSASRRWTWKA